MKAPRPFTVVLKEPGVRRPWHFHTVAVSEAEALRKARRFHPKWRHVETIAA